MSIKLNYQTLGNGEPVIILHGLFGSSRNWRSIAKRLAQTYQVITVDLRNHGQSGHAESMTFIDMADDLHALIDQLALRDITLIGHSMGGKVAMVTCLSYPDLINKLIILDIAPVTYTYTYKKLFSTMEELPLDSITNRNEAVEFMNAKIDDLWLSQFILQNLVRNNKGFQWQFNLPAIKVNINQITQFPNIDNNIRFELPVLFLGGADSDFIKQEHHPVIHSYFPNAEINMIENAGHMVHIDKPEELLGRIQAFMECRA